MSTFWIAGSGKKDVELMFRAWIKYVSNPMHIVGDLEIVGCVGKDIERWNIIQKRQEHRNGNIGKELKSGELKLRFKLKMFECVGESGELEVTTATSKMNF